MEFPEELANLLADVRSVGVITGAGVSVESGIRPYRGRGGLYDDPDEGERTMEALTGETLRRDPDRTWRAVAMLARETRDARPNPAHRAIVEMERRAERFALLTQNVDGLHQAAGSRNVIPIHGDVRATVCMACGTRGRLEGEVLAALDRAPRCEACGGTLRPGAVLFGEYLPQDQVDRMIRCFHAQVPDLLVVAGTSALFAYIVEPVLVAARAGRVTVEVNPEPTEITPLVRFFLQGPAGHWLPRVADRLPARAG